MAQSIEEPSFELTASALAEQERAVNALRTRAGTVIAAASVSSSFLAAKVDHGSLGGWGIAALIVFVMCLGATIWVLLPHELVFGFRGDTLLAVSDQEGVHEVSEAYRAAGRWMKPYLDSNRNTIAELSTWFTVSCGLIALEIVLGTISLTS